MGTIPMKVVRLRDKNYLYPESDEGHKLLDKYKDEEVLAITIKRTNKRTIKQNSYYWGVVITLILERFEDYGYTLRDLYKNAPPVKLLKTDIHDWLSVVFSREDIVDEETAEVKGVRKKRTSETDSEQFWEYIERVRYYAAEHLDLNIPDPDTPAYKI